MAAGAPNRPETEQSRDSPKTRVLGNAWSLIKKLVLVGTKIAR